MGIEVLNWAVGTNDKPWARNWPRKPGLGGVSDAYNLSLKRACLPKPRLLCAAGLSKAYVENILGSATHELSFPDWLGPLKGQPGTV